MNEPKLSVLVYEWQPKGRENIELALGDSAELSFQSDPKSLQQALVRQQFDLIFLRVKQENNGSFTLLKKIHEQSQATPLIATSETERAELIVKALRAGACDFLVDPLSPARLQLAVQKAMESRQMVNELAYLRRQQDIVYNFNQIIAESENFKAVLKSLRKFASTDASILLTGDTGTGKSFLSGSIHFNSPRRDHPFVKINCANIPETLLESELFGHEKGAFTGADKQRIGRFEQANHGTIFLDEIGEIPLEIQAKLLRVLEDKCFERVGGNRTIQVDVRLIAATNRNLPEQIAAGRFREDLFYRINVLEVYLPPLKERSRCLVPMARKLLHKASASMRKRIDDFSPEALAMIQGYNWPGNIRQLANTIERAVILEDSPTITPTSLQIPELSRVTAPLIQTAEPLETHERELILKALEENLWVQKNAARCLGISPRVLNYKINKFSITHPNWRKNKR